MNRTFWKEATFTNHDNRISDRKQKITKGGIEALASKLTLKNIRDGQDIV